MIYSALCLPDFLIHVTLVHFKLDYHVNFSKIAKVGYKLLSQHFQGKLQVKCVQSQLCSDVSAIAHVVIEAVCVTSKYLKDGGLVCCCFDYRVDVRLQNCMVHCVLLPVRGVMSNACHAEGEFPQEKD